METLMLVLLLVVMSSMKGHTKSIEVEKYFHFLETSDDGSGEVEESNLCVTEDCVATASDLLQSLDNDTDPCEDFYQFACGGWIKRQFLPPHRVSEMTLYNQDQHLATARNLLTDKPRPDDLEAVKKAKILYASCISNTQGSRDGKSIVKLITETFGVWPITGKECNTKTFSLQRFLSEAVRLGVHPLFQLVVELNAKMQEEGPVLFYHELEFKAPVHTLPISSYAKLLKDDISRQIYANKIVADAKRLFGIEDPERAEGDALKIVEVESTLAELYQELYDPAADNNFTLGLMDKSFGELLNWTDFVSTLASAPNIGITDISSAEEVSVSNPAYIRNLTEYFTQLPARTQVNYILWRVVDSLESVLIKDNTKMEVILKKTLLGSSSLPSPEEACVSYVSTAFSLVVHRLMYTDQLPPEEIKTMTKILKEIQQEFDELVDEHAWLDEETRELVKEKNAAIAVTLVNFERSMNDSLLESYYKNVTVDEEQFFRNVIQERRENFARNFRSLEKPYERTVDDLPHELVAQNFLLSNGLEFSSVLFEPPLFVNNVPMSVNYAGAGMIFGHEIVHSFDNTGIQFSKEGVPGTWWNNKSLEVFIERAQCMVEQYNKYLYKPAGKHVNGRLTLGENIADGAGVKLAYRAYKKHVARQAMEQEIFPGVPYTDEQVFFIKMAQNWCAVQTAPVARWQLLTDPHSPNEFRVTGSLQNSKDFARVFHCPLGSRMNPAQKCEVW